MVFANTNNTYDNHTGTGTDTDTDNENDTNTDNTNNDNDDTGTNTDIGKENDNTTDCDVKNKYKNIVCSRGCLYSLVCKEGYYMPLIVFPSDQKILNRENFNEIILAS